MCSTDLLHKQVSMGLLKAMDLSLHHLREWKCGLKSLCSAGFVSSI